MKHMTALAALFAAVTLAPAAAYAQSAKPLKISIDINGGAQTQSRTIATSTSFPLYGETAVINAAEAADSGGLFDFAVRYSVMKQLSVGVGFTTFSKAGAGSLVASVPSPTIINSPQNTTATATGLEHKEMSTHILLAYTAPLMDKFDLTVFAGPSFFKLTQDVLSGTVATGTQNITTATKSETGSKTGGIFGASINYMVKPNYGAGVFARWSGASVDLASAKGVKVGGFQVGGGLRLRF